MTAKEFLERYGASDRKLKDVLHKWSLEKEVDSFLNTRLAEGLLIADYFSNGEMYDQLAKKLTIPDELSAALKQLSKEELDTVSEIRDRFISLNEKGEASVRGFMLKAQGQLGEDAFLASVGDTAKLAESGSQEGWDVLINGEDGPRFVQVKVYEDADAVIRKMKEVNERVLAGEITGPEDVIVTQIDFAVSDNILEEVQRAAEELELPNKVMGIGASRDSIRAILEEGRDNCLNEELLLELGAGEFFQELLGSTATYGLTFMALNGLLVYLGAKEREQWAEDTFHQSLAGIAGATAATVADVIFLTRLEAAIGVLGAPIGLGGVLLVGMGTRAFVRRLSDRRFVAKNIVEGSKSIEQMTKRMLAA